MPCVLQTLPPNYFCFIPLQTVFHHVALWGSIIFTFVFNYVYCAIDTQQRLMDTLYVLQRASLRAEFWVVLILTPVIALLPRYAS